MAFEYIAYINFHKMKKFVLIGTLATITGFACISFQSQKTLPVIEAGDVKELPVLKNEAF